MRKYKVPCLYVKKWNNLDKMDTFPGRKNPTEINSKNKLTNLKRCITVKRVNW